MGRSPRVSAEVKGEGPQSPAPITPLPLLPPEERREGVAPQASVAQPLLCAHCTSGGSPASCRHLPVRLSGTNLLQLIASTVLLPVLCSSPKPRTLSQAPFISVLRPPSSGTAWSHGTALVTEPAVPAPFYLSSSHPLAPMRGSQHTWDTSQTRTVNFESATWVWKSVYTSKPEALRPNQKASAKRYQS